MKLHLPVRLRRALVSCMLVSTGVVVSSGSASADWQPKENLGNTMYVGDSITHGAYSNLYSWRWSMHKIFADNGISYTEVGVKTGNAGNAGINMTYGETLFLNKHSAQNSARAYEIAERRAGGRFGGTGIQHWLGLAEPENWSGKDVAGYRLGDTEKPVDTFFLLIGTNDLLSESPSIGTSLTTKENSLIGRSESSGKVSWSRTGDMDTIVNAMFEHNPNASVTILTVPTWGTHTNNNTAADYEAVHTYNEHLKAWVEQNQHKDNITLIDTNQGLTDVANTDMPWKGVDSLFYSSGDRLHPSAQGELIIAGNVARGLGYAGRTAGQERKAATEFNRQAQAIFGSATRKDNVTWRGGKGLTFESGATLTSDWGETSPEGTFTVDFKISGGLGDGATGGWDTQNGLTITVGDGSHSGALTLNEAYIKWGDTILYSMNMSELTSALRVAYVRGRNSQGLSTGFYVWLDDQLIGEALGSGTSAENGLSITNETGASITLSDLAMDSMGSWAPTSKGFTVGNPLITPADSSAYSGWSGVVDWPGQSEMLDETQVVNASAALDSTKFTNGKIGCTVAVSGVTPSIIKTWTGEEELFVTVEEGSAPTNWLVLDNVNGGTSTVNLHVRFSGAMTLPTIFCVLQNAGTTSYYHNGDMYVEFSGDLTINSGTFSMSNEDQTYASHGGSYHNVAISAFYTYNSNEKGAVNGKITYVINDGTYNGRVVGGEAYGVNGDETRVTKGVEIYLNGGTFNGDIYAGGTCGYIGGAKIVITGGLGTMTFNETVQRISAGGFGLQNTGGLADGKAAEIVLQDITDDDDGIARWGGELSGGRKPSDFEVQRKLVLKNVTALNATLAEFDEVEVTDGSELSLGALGGATKLTVKGSEFTLTDTNGYTGMTTYNGGVIILEKGVNYETKTEVEPDDQVAASLSGRYEVKNGAKLQLSADEHGSVRGNVEVVLQGGGTYTSGLSGKEEGGGSVMVHLHQDEESTDPLTVQLAEGTESGAVIRVQLEGFTEGTRVRGWKQDSDYTLQLVGAENALVLGDGVRVQGERGERESVFDTAGAITFETGAALTVNVKSESLEDGEVIDMEFAVGQGDLSSWNNNDQVLVSQELDRLGWVSHWTKEGTLALHRPGHESGRGTYESSSDNKGTEWNKGYEENIYDAVGKYSDVVIDSTTNINFASAEEVPADYWGDGLEIHNLRGTRGGSLTITGDGGKNGVVTLVNRYSTKEGAALSDGVLRYAGDITVHDARLGVFHTDTGREENSANLVTEVSGRLDLSDADGLMFKSGILRLTGEEENDLGNFGIEFKYDTEGQLSLSGASASVGGTISVIQGSGSRDREHIFLEKDSLLKLKDGAVVGSGTVIGNSGNWGRDGSRDTVSVNGKVQMKGGSKLVGVHLVLGSGGALQLENAEEDDLRLLGLESGSRAGISGGRDMELQLSAGDHVFSGDLSEYHGTMTFKDSKWTQYFTQETKGNGSWGLELEKGAHVHLNAITSLGVNDGMSLGNVHVGDGGELTLGFTLAGGAAGHSASVAGFSFGDFKLSKDAQLVLYAEGGNPTETRFVLGTASGTIDLIGASEASATSERSASKRPVQKQEKEVQVKGDSLLHVDSAIVKREGNEIIAEFVMAKTNKLAEAIVGAHQNAQEGAEAVWEATGQLYSGDTDMAKLAAGVTRAMESGDSSTLASMLAASVGAGLTGLSPALSQDVHGRMTALRNRVSCTSWGEGVNDLVESYPYYHFWVNGEANYHELDEDGLASGYRLNSWGGSLGITAEVSSRTRVGLSLTEMTGDYKCRVPDIVDGDLLTTWLGLFLSTTSGAWQHTLVLTGGIADISVERTVSCGSGSYRTEGSTDGLAAGLLYELGYTAYVNAESSSALQGIFNVEWRYASIKGYTETGSDAGLQVEKMEQNVVTFGIGARWQHLMSANIANRNPLLELRALAKADVGDDCGEAKTRLIGQHYTTNLRGAETGAFGVEIGGEISIPLGGRSARIFVDAGAELRSGYTSAEASIGLRTIF